MSRQLTDLQLEKFNADVLSPADKATVERVLAASPDDTEALRLLRADDAALFTALPPAAFAARVSPEKKKSRSLGWLFGAVAAAALAVVAWQQQPDDAFRVKGDVAWAVRADGPRALQAHARVHGGETLAFEVTTAEPVWAAVVSHAPDGWFVYVPATRVEAGVTTLPVGAQLDATTGDETLFLITAPTTFDAEAVKQALVDGGRGEWKAEAFPLRKE